MNRLLSPFAAATMAASSLSRAQCPPQWVPQDGVLPGVSGMAVNAMVKWDPDGSGPQPVVLVVGGVIWRAGGVAVSGLAAWDGAMWRHLDDFSDSYVTRLAVHNGQLIVARHNSPYLSDAEIYSLGPGPGPAYMGVTSHTGHSQVGAISGLATWQGQLIAAGSFTHLAGQPFENIAVWNGAAWQPFASGVPPAYALVLHMGQPVVSNGGAVRAWNGVSWQVLGDADGWISALAVYNNELIAGGSFATMGGHATNLIARWDGTSWHAMAGGVGIPGTNDEVRAMRTYNGELIAGGVFNSQYGWHTGPGVKRWNGASWQNAGSGMLGDPPAVGALETYKGALVAAGSFSAAGGKPASRISSWSPVTGKWYPIGPSTGYFTSQSLSAGAGGHVESLASHTGEVIASGYCITVDGKRVTLVRRDNATREWRTIGNASVFPDAMTTYDGELIIGGSFTSVGGVPAGRIARWDGATWQPLHWGMTNIVRALTVRGGDLIAGGDFVYAGGQTVNRVAAWNGAAWSSLGAGVNASVRALAVHSNDLIAAGYFVSAGGQPANRIARWNGAAWSPMAGGLEFTPSLLAVAHGELIAFNPSYASPTIKRWNGASWLPLYGLSGNAYAALVYNGDLLVGGSFTQAGFNQVKSLARWDGDEWHPFSAGPAYASINSATVNTLALHGQELLVGGSFEANWGDSVYQWARVGCACYPDCNNNQSLGIGDFACFQTQFVVAHPYADCNADGLHTIADFACFQTRFAAGCP